MPLPSKPESTRDLFPALFNNAAAPMAVTRINGTHLKVNRAFCEFLDYSEEELLGLNVLDITHPDDRGFTSAQFRTASEKKQNIFQYEKRYLRKCGKVVWGLVSASWILDEPEPPYSVVLIQDITARKESERALRESEELYRTLVENTDLGINLIGEDRRILKVNAATSRRFSRPASSFVGKECFREFEKRDEVCEHCPGTFSMACRQSRKTLTEGTRPDGSRYVLRLHTFPVLDADGQARKFVEVIEDITDRIEARDALRAGEKRFRAIFENAGAGMCTVSADRRFLQVNRALCRYLGYTEGELLGMTLDEVTHPGDLDMTLCLIGEAQASPPFTLHYEKRYRHKNGSTLWAQVSSVWNMDDVGPPAYSIGMIQDITERKSAEAQLLLKTRAIEASGNGIMICAASFPELPIVYVNPAFERITGFAAEEVLGRSPNFLSGKEVGESIEITAMLRRGAEAVELRKFRKDGSFFWSELSVSPVREPGGKITDYVVVINDISDRKQYQEKLEYQATHDPLTGLANRSLLLDRLEQNLVYADRSERIVAVLLLDLDRFKVINDSLGHSQGDALLQMVAERLKGCIRAGDTVSRLGGDEFVVVLAEVAELDDVGLLANRIREKLAEPFTLADHELRVTASIGISLYPKDGAAVDEMVRHADMAMYRAKAEGGDSFFFFAPEMNVRIQGTLELEADLRQAIERGEFFLHYQPQVVILSGRIVGCEALVRWRHPKRGLVSPGTFIPMAEETGLIVPLGEWVLKEACAQAKAWHEAGLDPVKVAVNLSARQFRQAGLIDLVVDTLQTTGLPPGMLNLELTESMIMHDVAGAAEIMRQLADLGVGLCLDDFGTGYSSLNYLRRFPVDYLKIDRSFIADVTSDSSGAAVTTSIVAIAHSLGIGAVAEGVETREQFDFLAGCGCDAFQGYLFSKPLPPEEFAILLGEPLPPTKAVF